MTVDDFHPQARKLYESPGYQRVVRDLKRGKGKNRNTGKRSPGIPGRKLYMEGVVVWRKNWGK